MNEDMSKLLSGMLQNPDAIKNLMNSIGGSSSNSSEKAENTSNSPSIQRSDLESSVKSMMSVLNQADDRRITLLNALKPYLSSSRADGIDRAIRILKLTKLSEVLRNERE